VTLHSERSEARRGERSEESPQPEILPARLNYTSKAGGRSAQNQKNDDMTTMRLAIDESTKRKYNLQGGEISFDELRLRILGQDSIKRLRKLHRIAKDTGLNKMTMKEINQEIKAYRDESKLRVKA
jgi:hypothetical protein